MTPSSFNPLGRNPQRKRPSAVITKPVRASAARTAPTLSAIFRPCLKLAAMAAALSGPDAVASIDMTAAVWAKSSSGKAGRGPASIKRRHIARAYSLKEATDYDR